ncbi:hypothetical protein BGW41_004214 [Actinomortierella wolfii]|nr:hypothetical protein BGW41_004214 [Actinomortierella wolfii]
MPALTFAHDAIQSRGIFLGQDTSDNKATGEAIFSDPKNHPMAVASILKFTAEKANFYPHSDGPVKSIDAFETFTDQWSKLPGLRTITQTKSMLVLSDGRSREDFKRAVAHADLRDDAHREIIAQELARLIPETLPNKHVKEWTLFLAVIKKKPQEQEPQPPREPSDPGHDSLDMLFTDCNVDGAVGEEKEHKVILDLITVTLRLKSGDHVEIGKQEAFLYLHRLETDVQRLEERAPTYAKLMKKTTVAEYEKYFTTVKTGNQWIHWANAAIKHFFSQVFLF